MIEVDRSVVVRPVFAAHKHAFLQRRHNAQYDSYIAKHGCLPEIHFWPRRAARRISAIQPSLLAIDSLSTSSGIEDLYYLLPENPFSSNTSQSRYILGGDVTGHNSNFNWLQADLMNDFWNKDDLDYGDRRERLFKLGKFVVKDPAMMFWAARMGLIFSNNIAARQITEYATELGTLRALLGLSLLASPFLDRIPPNTTHVLVGLCKYLGLSVDDINFRNALVSIKLDDAYSYLSGFQEQILGSNRAVVLFGASHAYGVNLWNNPEAQKQVIMNAIDRMIIPFQKRVRAQRQDDDLIDGERFDSYLIASELQDALARATLWEVGDAPVNYTPEEVSRSLPIVARFKSPTISSIIEERVARLWQ